MLRDLAADAPDEVGIMGNLRLAPPLPIIPEELQGKPIVALVLTYAGRHRRRPEGPPADPRRAARARGQRRGAQAVRRAPEDVRRGVAARAPLLLEVAQARAAHRRRPIAVIIEQAEQITSPLSSSRSSRRAAPSRVFAADATAFANRDATHDINIVGSWLPDDPEPDRHIAWVREMFDALEPFSKGVYVNFTSDDAG